MEEDAVSETSSHEEHGGGERVKVLVRPYLGGKRRYRTLSRNSEKSSGPSAKSQLAKRTKLQDCECESVAESGVHAYHREDVAVKQAVRWSRELADARRSYEEWRATVALSYARLTSYRLPNAAPSLSIAFVDDQSGREVDALRLVVASKALFVDDEAREEREERKDTVALREAHYLQSVYCRRTVTTMGEWRAAWQSLCERSKRGATKMRVDSHSTDLARASIVHGAAAESAFPVYSVAAMPRWPFLIATRSESPDIAVYELRANATLQHFDDRPLSRKMVDEFGVEDISDVDDELPGWHGHADLNRDARLAAVLAKRSGNHPKNVGDVGVALDWSAAAPGERSVATLVSGDANGEIAEYRLSVGAVAGDADSVELASAQSFASDGRWLAVGASRVYRATESECTALACVPAEAETAANLFASGTMDGMLLIWDRRCGKGDACVRRTMAGFDNSAVHALAWNRLRCGEIASADDTGKVRVWDVRNLKRPCRETHQHRGAVSRLAFAPFDCNILASAGVDGLVCLTDDRDYDGGGKGGASGDVGDAAASAPHSDALQWAQLRKETRFVHAGHCAAVTDMRFAPDCRDLTVASTDAGGVVQVWTPNPKIFERGVA